MTAKRALSVCLASKVRPAVRTELERLAGKKGLSLSAYVARLLEARTNGNVINPLNDLEQTPDSFAREFQRSTR